MNLMRRLLSFGSEDSRLRWLKIIFAVLAMIVAGSFLFNLAPAVVENGIAGLIFSVIIFVFVLGPTLLVFLGIATLIGVVVGGTRSGIKQHRSLRETARTGSAELMALEKLRLKSRRLDLLLILLIAALIAGFFLIAFFVVDYLPTSMFEIAAYGYLFAAALIVVAFETYKAPTKVAYKQAFKEIVVIKGLEAVLTNMDFRPEEKLDESIVRAAGLFPEFNIYTGNDYLAADYEGRHFIQSDIGLLQKKVETYRDKDGEMQTRTTQKNLYTGRLTVFDFDALSDEPVTVVQRGSGWRQAVDEEIRTELDAFNRQFSIIAANPIAAMRILTPPVLEGILLAANKLRYPVSLSFRDDKLYVAVKSGDTLEAAGGDTTLSEQRQRVAEDIKAMLDLVATIYLRNERGASA